MDSDATIQQFVDLEKQLANESRQLAEEQVRHKDTQAQLSKAQENLSQTLMEAREARQRVAELETEKFANTKSIQQLKDSIKDVKNQNELLQKQMNEEKAALAEKREWYTNQMTKVNAKLRELTPKEAQIQDPEVTEDDNKMDIDQSEVLRLQERVAALEKEKEAITTQTKAELAKQSAEVAEEFRKLDHYVKQLEGALEKSRDDYAAVCQRPCPHCHQVAAETVSTLSGQPQIPQ